MNRILPLLLLTTGLLLFALYYFWPGVTAPQWTDAKEQQYFEAGRQLHAAHDAHEHRLVGKESQKQDVAEAQAEWDRQRAAFDDARNAGRRNGRILYWTALALFGAGIVSHVWSGRAEQ